MNESNTPENPMDGEKRRLFDSLYLECRVKLFNYVNYAMNHQDVVVAEDIVQECFYEAWRKMDELLEHPNPGGWLMNAAKYKLREYYHKANPYDVELEDWLVQLCRPEPSYNETELKVMLEKTLDPHDLELFILYFVEKHSTKELDRLSES